MDTLKFIFTSIIVLVLVGAVGYWAVTTMQTGTEHVNTQKIRTLEDENQSLKLEIERLNAQLASTQTTTPTQSPETPVVTPAPEKPTTPVKTPTTTKPTTTTYKNQTLINDIQKLANAGVVLKLKSVGPAVGSVQKFLNLYNKTSNKVDNDYGASTKTAVAAFQKAQGLTASGEAGKATFTKMVAWLKKQG